MKKWLRTYWVLNHFYSAFHSLGRNEEAVNHCKEWIRKEPENITAATAAVYAFIDTKEFDEDLPFC